jgi:uncharacterized membrane protein YagU involved in acid resistance
MMEPSAISRLIRAGLVTGVTDGLFSSVLSAFFYGSTVTRLFQGVAAVLIGTAAFDGGARTAAIGLLMHFGVAFGWSAVFLIVYLSSAWIRSLATSSAGVVAIAAVYGPLVWIVMSMAIVPLFTHRPPTINIRWWVQFFGHIPFVALPIVTMISRTA